MVRAGVPLQLHRTVSLFDPASLCTKAGSPFLVYTPFSRAALATGGPPPPLPKPARISGVAPSPRSDALADWALLPTKPDWAGGLREMWQPGEDHAQRRLRSFVSQSLADYAGARDQPGVDGTSRLSPHLHFGEISAAGVWHEAMDHGSAAKFINELLWREFSLHLLWHHPHLPDRPLRETFAAMPWRRDRRALRHWQRGETGIPIVDAGMRQLWHTGWMHNRVRMIAASFLVKHLLIHWRDGEAWFWDTLVDADLANNSANWQWIAGCGADAAPYFRIFNPVLQGGSSIRTARMSAPGCRNWRGWTQSSSTRRGMRRRRRSPKPAWCLGDPTPSRSSISRKDVPEPFARWPASAAHCHTLRRMAELVPCGSPTRKCISGQPAHRAASIARCRASPPRTCWPKWMQAGVDAAIIHPPSWDPNANTVAIEAVRNHPGRFAHPGPVSARSAAAAGTAGNLA